jgi:hypothetical protein
LELLRQPPLDVSPARPLTPSAEGSLRGALQVKSTEAHIGANRMSLKIKFFAFKILNNFSHFPLRMASFLAFVLANLSGFSIIAVILLRLLRENLLLKSQASILVALLFLLGAVQLISLGIIGETIGRMDAIAHSGTPLPEWAARQMGMPGPSARKPYEYN